MACSPLSSLTPRDQLKTICVHVSRKWELRGINDDGPLQHIDLILADDKGNVKYAEIPAAEAERHGPVFKAGNCYVLSRFRVCNAKDFYRSVPGPYMLELTCHTRISPSDHPGPFPEYVYYLTPFENVRDYIGDRKKFHDVLGVLVEVAEPEWVHFCNQPKPKLRRNILIKDQRVATQADTLPQEIKPRDPKKNRE